MAKAPGAMAMAGKAAAVPAAASIAKLPMPNSMSLASILGRQAPSPGSIGKLPLNLPMVGPGTEKKSFLDKLFGGMDKDKMRELGLGLMSQAMGQGQQQQAPLQLAPFQPGSGGGGGMQGGPPALMQLMQQYGMNKIQ